MTREIKVVLSEEYFPQKEKTILSFSLKCVDMQYKDLEKTR